MGFINWIKIQFLRYERHHARYMQAFLRSEIDHQRIAIYSFDWWLLSSEINAWEAQEVIVTNRIKALEGK